MKDISQFEEILSQLSKISPLKMALAIFNDWFFIVLIILVCDNFFSWPLYIFSALFISTKMHALGVLSHDAVHYRIAPKKIINDLIANLFLCWPLFIKVQGYRNEHFPHHKYVNSDLDPDLIRKKNHPDWIFPKTKRNLFKIFLFDILGINLGQYAKRLKFSLHYQSKKKEAPSMQLGRILFYLIIVSFLQSQNLWKEFFLYWIIPYITFFKAIRRIRTLAEHFAIKNGDTRTVLPFFWERLLFSPHSVNFHAEHHLFPHIPFYNLKKLHKALMNSPYKDQLYFTKSYLGVIKEATQFQGVS